jgi:hypothetical protein
MSRSTEQQPGVERDISMGMTVIEKREFKGGVSAVEPLAASIPDACHISGLSRSEIYRRLATGDIRAVKSGVRTLILLDSLRAHLASLPAATFRAPKSA